MATEGGGKHLRAAGVEQPFGGALHVEGVYAPGAAVLGKNLPAFHFSHRGGQQQHGKTARFEVADKPEFLCGFIKIVAVEVFGAEVVLAVGGPCFAAAALEADFEAGFEHIAHQYEAVEEQGGVYERYGFAGAVEHGFSGFVLLEHLVGVVGVNRLPEEVHEAPVGQGLERGVGAEPGGGGSEKIGVAGGEAGAGFGRCGRAVLIGGQQRLVGDAEAGFGDFVGEPELGGAAGPVRHVERRFGGGGILVEHGVVDTPPVVHDESDEYAFVPQQRRVFEVFAGVGFGEVGQDG